MACLTEDELIEQLLEGEPPEEVSLHAAECPGCAQRLDELSEMTAGLSSFCQTEPPPAVVQRAQALVTRPGWLQRVLETVRAVLVTDSAVLAPAPVRGAADDAAEVRAKRYLCFRAENSLAELHIIPNRDGSYDLAGRLVEPLDQAPFAVIAKTARGSSFPRMSDDHGHFNFPSLPRGDFELCLELDQNVLVLAPVDLH